MKFPKITLILRDYPIEASVEIAKILDEYVGFALEIALNSKNAFETLSELSKLELENLLIGAGTVLNIDLLKKAINHGVRFVLSPIMMTREMIELCNEKNIKAIPSGYTPSEIYRMLDFGADIVKVFPANSFELNYFTSIQAPLGSLPLMAVGGVNLDNLNNFFKNGVKYAGIGSGLSSMEKIEAQDFSDIRKNVKKLVEIMAVNYD